MSSTRTALLAATAATFSTFAGAAAQPIVGAKGFVGIEVGASRFEIAEAESEASRVTNDSNGLTYALEAGVSLPIQLSFGAFYRRYDGDVQSASDESVTWGMDANELGVLAEWRFPLGPASLMGLSTGAGGQASLLAIDGARSAEELVATAVEGRILAGRLYAFAGVPVKSRVSLLVRAGWAIAEVPAEKLEDGMAEGEPQNAADYSGFFAAGGLRLSLF